MAQKGVVQGPNQARPGNHVNSCGPMQHGHGDVNAPNNANKTARTNSSGPQQRTHPGMPNPNQNQKFRIEDADEGYRGFAAPVASTGVGAIPVEPKNPFSRQTFVPAHLLRDTAKR